MIPTHLSEWIASLPSRPGWQGWESVGTSVYEGVQNWSTQGDESVAIGVWGIVRNPEPYTWEAPAVEFSIYIGNDRDPHRRGFDTAEDAMRAAESDFPELFTERNP